MAHSATNQIRSIFATLAASFALAAFLVSPGSPSFADAPTQDELKIVFIAYENPDQLIEDVTPVLDYLKSRLGMNVRHYVATDYSGVVEALRNGTADVGFMGPLQYVKAREIAGAQPVLGEVYSGKASYVSRIFVRKDSGITKIEDLRDKSIAFVDPISSSGYMYPLDIFNAAGLIDGRGEDFFGDIYFAGGDQQAIRAVYHGFTDAAGIGQYSFNLLRPEERDELISIGQSRPIPSHCLVARKDLNQNTLETLKQSLLALNEEGPNHGLLKHLYGVDGYVEVTPEDYAEVEKLGRDYGFIR